MHLRDAAAALGVHYQTAYGWVREGVLPARKTSRGYEVSDSAVRALAERRLAGLRRRPASGSGTGRCSRHGSTTPWSPVTRQWRGSGWAG